MNINAGGPGGGAPMSPVRMGSPLIGPGGTVEFEWADIQARLVCGCWVSVIGLVVDADLGNRTFCRWCVHYTGAPYRIRSN